LFLKIIASSLTTASGGIGGVFAPSLFAGGILGFTFSRIINASKIVNVSEHNFALVGMAGVMSAIMHAPMTSIFLIAEITGGYNLFCL
jgi:CIC family chloride channel protein